MLQIAIIGLGTLGIRMLEELAESDAELIIIDKDEEIVEQYKKFATAPYILDATNENALQEVISKDLDVAIIDMSNNLEAAIMTTNYLHKLGIKKIIVEARNNRQGEVLETVGATKIVYPELEAAKRITPMLFSNNMEVIQLSPDFALTEITISDALVGQTLGQTHIRQDWNLNVVAYREDDTDDFQFVSSPNFKLEPNYKLLVAGKNEDITRYSALSGQVESDKKTNFFIKLLKKSDIKKKTEDKKDKETKSN